MYVSSGSKALAGKLGFLRLLFLLKKEPLMVVDDQWWRKQAVLIGFGQIETLGAFWRRKIGRAIVGAGSRWGWIKTIESICVRISELYYTLLILLTPHIGQ